MKAKSIRWCVRSTGKLIYKVISGKKKYLGVVSPRSPFFDRFENGKLA